MFRHVSSSLLLLLVTQLVRAAVPEFFAVRTGGLFIAASDLATNGIPGLSNPAAGVTISAHPTNSLHGGIVSIVSTQVWSKLYRGSNNYDQTFVMAVDASNNVCVSGYTIHPGNNADFLTVKYAGDGRPLWTNLYDGLTHSVDYGRLVAMDREGNVFVSGEDSYDFVGPFHVATIKYSAQGVPLWTNRFNLFGTNQHTPTGLVTDSDGRAYLSIFTYGSAEVGYITIKYEADGQPAWTNFFKSDVYYSGAAASLAVNQNGQVFVTGASSFGMSTIKYANNGPPLWTNSYSAIGFQGREIALDGQHGVLVLGENGVGGGGDHVYVLVKYSNSGQPIWTNVIRGPQYQGGNLPQLFTGPDASVYLLGGSPGASSDNVDLTVTKFSESGAVVWMNRLFESNFGNPAPARACVDRTGNFFLVYSAGPDFAARDFVVVKYTSDGRSLWTNRFDGAAHSSDIPAASVTDAWGAVYVTGFTRPQNGVWNSATVKFAELIRYTPPPNFVGTDSFMFLATDSSGVSTTNWATIHVQAESLWFNVARSSFRVGENGTPRLHLDGAGSTGVVNLHASTNLISWMPIATNAPVNDVVEFDLQPNWPQQFYRAAIITP